MKHGLLVALASLALAGCVAETVEKHPPRRGPVKEVGYIDMGGGRVRYSAEGWSWVLASRRRTAERLMRRNCGDLVPRITDEFTREDADAAYAGEDVTSSLAHGDEHFKIERWVHISYECRAPGAVDVPPMEKPR